MCMAERMSIIVVEADRDRAVELTREVQLATRVEEAGPVDRDVGMAGLVMDFAEHPDLPPLPVDHLTVCRS